MTRFISSLDQTLRSLSGCSVGFLAGVPTYVPPQAEAEALAIGCVVEGTAQPVDAAALAAEAAQVAADAAAAAVAAETTRNAATD